MLRIRVVPRPSSVTLWPPSMTMLRLTGTSIVVAIGMVTGSAPQLKVTTECEAMAARRAASVQLCGVPLPTLGALPVVGAGVTGAVQTGAAAGTTVALAA